MLGKKIAFSLVLITLFLCNNLVFANRFLTLPFDGEYSMNCGFYCYKFDEGKYHSGSDYLMPIGTPIVAADDGFAIAFADPKKPPSYGNHIDIDHINGLQTRYAHLDSFAPGIMAGNGAVQVYRGQIIGYSGATGGPWRQSDGTERAPAHLHFEVLINGVKVDPYDPDNFLWTTDPPSHAYFNQFDFHFPNGFSQGWQCADGITLFNGIKGDVLGFKTAGEDSNVESPSFSCGLKAEDCVVLLKAGITGASICGAKVEFKDEHGKWNDSVPLSVLYDMSDLSINSWFQKEAGTLDQQWLFDGIGFQGFSENDFQVWKAGFANSSSPSSEIKQVRVTLDNRKGIYEIFDDVIICSKARS